MSHFPTIAAAAGLILATGGFAMSQQRPAPAAMVISSAAVVHRFQQLHPCPTTGLRFGTCPGYVRVHVVPLCAGGADAPDNMRWQTLPQALARIGQARCGS